MFLSICHSVEIFCHLVRSGAHATLLVLLSSKCFNLGEQAEAAESHNNSSKSGNTGGASRPTNKGHSSSSGSAISKEVLPLTIIIVLVFLVARVTRSRYSGVRTG